jgi:AcrR family transcriptional regulator
MVQQEQVLPHVAEGSIPEQRNGLSPARRGNQLRVDARRNLESVLRAAREIFGELGYGAPMEEVARRAGVGVGTVYRRFPSKEVLVHRIASEEIQWLTAQAEEALSGDQQPWDALAGYLSRAVATGAGRLLPPEAFQRALLLDRVPPQYAGTSRSGEGLPAQPAADPTAGQADVDPARLQDLLELLSRLVALTRAAGDLRPGVTVADVVLVLTASVPVQSAAPEAARPESRGSAVEPLGSGNGRAEAGAADGTSARLLRILLDGLRAGS